MPYDAICLQTLHDCAPPWEGRLRRERLIGEVLVPLIAPVRKKKNVEHLWP